jgi:hypothetical protein
MKLTEALTTNDSFTANGAVTHSTTSSALLDLFFVAGASRNMSETQILSMWTKAFYEDEDLALRLLLWSRDCRGGAGERRFFRMCYRWLKGNVPHQADRVAKRISELGRWDDMWTSGPLSSVEKELIAEGLLNKNGLLAKWIPRRSSVFYELANYCGQSLSKFRKTLVKLSNTVEQKMTEKDYSFPYSSVPSVAMSRYGKAFARNDQTRFTEYLAKVNSGEEKINASVVMPYDLVIDIVRGNKEVAIEQWKSLPNYYTDENILVVADVSGSMTWTNSTPRPLDVCLSLAIYTSERNRGIFKDTFITFTSDPTLQQLKGDLESKLHQIQGPVGYNTDFQKVFDVILSKAKNHGVPAEEMPTKVIVISDMEFDEAGPDTNFDAIRAKYEASRYKMPQMVFWNVNGRVGNNPVKHNTQGVALVSGASPSILKSVLGDLNPMSVMLETIGSDRYSL